MRASLTSWAFKPSNLKNVWVEKEKDNFFYVNPWWLYWLEALLTAQFHWVLLGGCCEMSDCVVVLLLRWASLNSRNKLVVSGYPTLILNLSSWFYWYFRFLKTLSLFCCWKISSQISVCFFTFHRFQLWESPPSSCQHERQCSCRACPRAYPYSRGSSVLASCDWCCQASQTDG